MLSQRIIRALASGVNPKKMLRATFMNRAAFEMRAFRKRGFAGRIRKATAYDSFYEGKETSEGLKQKGESI